jgi:hypothetical protein
MQVHFGNVESIKLNLLNDISQGIRTLCHILDPDGTKRAEFLNAFREDGQSQDQG